MTAACAATGYATPEPSVPLTASEATESRPIKLTDLLREGLVVMLVVFAITGPESLAAGVSKEVRQFIVVQGFIGMLIGIFVAKTAGGRLFLALAYTVFYEYQYFQPPTFYLVPLPPCVGLVLAALVVEIFRASRPPLLTINAGGLRAAILILTGALFLGVLVAASFSPAGLERAMIPTLERWGPLLLFALLGAIALRRGEGGLFMDLLPYLAAVNCVTVWIYTLTGERVLYYEDIFAFREVIGRFGGMLRNGNNTGFFCGAAVIIILARLHRYPLPLKIIGFANALFLSGTIALVRSRAPLVMIAFFLPFLLWNRKSRGGAMVFPVCAAIGYVAAGGLLAATQGRDEMEIGERFAGTTEAILVRWQVFLDALGVAAANPFGVGELGGVISAESESGFKLEAHNEYAGFIARDGFQSLAALALLVAAVVAGWYAVVTRKLPHRPGFALTLLLFCFLFTFNVEPIFSNSFELARLFGAVAGMFVSSVLFAYPQVRPAAFPGPAQPRPGTPVGAAHGPWRPPAPAAETGRFPRP